MPKKAEKVKLAKIQDKEIVAPGKRSIETLFSWSAPSRIWKPKDKTWYLSSAAIILAVILFIVLSKYPAYPWLIICLIAFMILWFIQGSLAPDLLRHKITNKGIFTLETLYRWEDISHFWIARKDAQSLVYIDFWPQLRQPRLTLLIDQQYEDEIFDILISQTKYGTPAEAQYNVAAKWLYGTYQPISQYLPDLDTEDKQESTTTETK